MAIKKVKKKKKVDEHREDLAREMIELIRNGEAVWNKPWKTGGGHMPINVETGREYTGSNTLTLLAAMEKHKYTDPRWGTFDQLKCAAGAVRKGERGTDIMRPIGPKAKGAKKEAKKLKVMKPPDDDLLGAHDFVLYKVFNVAQTNQGDKLPLPRSIPEWRTHVLAEKIVKAHATKRRFGSKVRVYQSFTNNRTTYKPDERVIEMPSLGQFGTKAGYYQTVFWGIGHDILAHHLTRDSPSILYKSGLDAMNRRALEELRVQIAICFTCMRLGIGYNPQQGMALVRGWSDAGKSWSILKANRREVSLAISDAQRIADALYRPVEDQTPGSIKRELNRAVREQDWRAVARLADTLATMEGGGVK